MKLQSEEKLLSACKRILKHQKEIEKLKGENFNIFSILKMESKENATHSAFLGELLNPKGSHSKGNIFLKLFIEKLLPTEEDEDLETKVKTAFNTEKASLKLEFFIGKVETDNNIKSGGRIDIYLWDDKGNTISIENKIYAKDQEAQIERYCNFNKDKNTVFYLTLKGEEPSEKSKGALEAEKDFYNISYAHDIVSWLEDCLKESADHPILRESIKQYIILIKRLTHQLTDRKMQKEVQELISKNYLSSKLIAENIDKTELMAATLFINDIKSKLDEKFNEKELNNDWKVTVDKDLNERWSGLKITHTTWKGIKIKLEGGPKVAWNSSNYGVYAPRFTWDRKDLKSKTTSSELLNSGFKENKHWPYHKHLFSMNSPSEKARMFDSEKREILIDDAVTQLYDLAIECLPLLKDVQLIKK